MNVYDMVPGLNVFPMVRLIQITLNVYVNMLFSIDS